MEMLDFPKHTYISQVLNLLGKFLYLDLLQTYDEWNPQFTSFLLVLFSSSVFNS